MERVRVAHVKTAIAAFRRRDRPASPPSRGSVISVALFYVKTIGRGVGVTVWYTGVGWFGIQGGWENRDVF
jgi:hypothetical protein